VKTLENDRRMQGQKQFFFIIYFKQRHRWVGVKARTHEQFNWLGLLTLHATHVVTATADHMFRPLPPGYTSPPHANTPHVGQINITHRTMNGSFYRAAERSISTDIIQHVPQCSFSWPRSVARFEVLTVASMTITLLGCCAV
jgi:hypothetical protein